MEVEYPMSAKRKSLKAKIIVTIGVVVTAAIYLLSTSANIVTMSIYKEQMTEVVSSKLTACSEKLDAWLEHKMTQTKFIAEEVSARGYLDDKEKCREFFADCSDRDSEIFETYIGYEDSTVVFGSGWAPTVEELDPVTRGWYKAAIASDKVIVTDPYIDAQTGKVVITCSVRVMKDGNAVGVLAQDMFIDEIQNVVNDLSIDEKGYALLTSADGTLIVHNDPEYSMSVDSSGKEVKHNISEAFKSLSITSDESKDSVDYKGDKVKYNETSSNVSDWKLGYALNSAEYNSKINSTVVMFLIMTVLYSVIIVVIVSVLIRNAFKPLNVMAEKSKEVSAGNLGVTFGYDRNDEIGDVCSAIEDNNRVVKNYIDDIKNRLGAISHGDFSVRSNVEYIGDYSAIKTSLDSISQSLGEVFNGIENASASVYNGAESASSESGQLSESVSKQTELIENIVDGMKDLSEKIDNNVSRTDSARNEAHETMTAVEAEDVRMKNLLDAMKEISESSDKIKNIIGTIEDIAFQTNILALNASVEAARAGAAGKGFAVVADEVRNLAGKSAEASESTSKLIERSAEAVNRGMKIAEDTSLSLGDVVSRTDKIDKIIIEINEESHEQRTRLNEVNSMIESVSDYVTSCASYAEESAAASEELNGQAASLKQMLDKFRA